MKAAAILESIIQMEKSLGVPEQSGDTAPFLECQAKEFHRQERYLEEILRKETGDLLDCIRRKQANIEALSKMLSVAIEERTVLEQRIASIEAKTGKREAG